MFCDQFQAAALQGQRDKQSSLNIKRKIYIPRTFTMLFLFYRFSRLQPQKKFAIGLAISHFFRGRNHKNRNAQNIAF